MYYFVLSRAAYHEQHLHDRTDNLMERLCDHLSTLDDELDIIGQDKSQSFAALQDWLLQNQVSSAMGIRSIGEQDYERHFGPWCFENCAFMDLCYLAVPDPDQAVLLRLAFSDYICVNLDSIDDL